MNVETIAFAQRGGVSRLGDLYRPMAARPPVILAVHGGGWRRGERTDLQQWAIELAHAGFAVFAIDYAKSESGAAYPNNVEDVASAANFLRTNGDTLGLDASRIGGLGASAGAHLLALSALQSATSPVQAMALVYGVYDLADNWRADRRLDRPREEDPTERMMGAPPEEQAERYRQASPLAFAERARGKQILVIWGDADTIVQPTQSETFAEAIRAQGAMVETRVVAGAGHFWFSKESVHAPDSYAHKVVPDIVSFFERHLT